MNIHVMIETEQSKRSVSYPLSASPLVVGRDPSCNLHLDDAHISRRHALIHIENQALRVEDTSTNGTLANGHILHRKSIHIPFGSPILLGTHTLHIYDQEGEGEHHLNSEGTISDIKRHVEPPPLSSSSSPPTPRKQSGLPPLPPRPLASPTIVPQADEAFLAERPTLSGSEGAQPLLPPAAPLSGEPLSADAPLRREIHKRLLEHLDLATTDAKKIDEASFRPRVLTALRRIVRSLDARIDPRIQRDQLIGEMADEALGLGPLEHLLADASISEIMVVDSQTIFVEKAGKIVQSEAHFTDEDRVRAVIERIVTPLGRRIDESSPLVDARLADGSRVNAIIQPLALKGSCITIRKFSKVPLKMDDLLRFGALSEPMARFLSRSVECKKNIVISGGTGSGKTTLLNVLSAAIPEDERIVTIEDSAELQLRQPHVVSLETRPPNMEGKGEYSIRDLVKNALRMRPDRIVVGECRGGEALDMLQAMNTGHDGSLTTTHANSPIEALARLETLCLMAGINLPSRAIREQIASSVHLIVQQSRLSDGSRRVTAISELGKIDPDGQFELRTIYAYRRTGTNAQGKVLGHHEATGYLPSFLDQFIVRGLIQPGEPYL